MKPTLENLVRLAYSSSKDKSLGQRVEVLFTLIGRKTLIKRVKNDDILQVVNTLKSKNLSGATINRYLSILSKVVANYRRSYDPTFAIHIPWQKEGPGRFEWLRKDEEAKVISYLEANELKDLKLTLQTLVLTGMRLGEFLSLEVKQIEDDWIRLWETKTNRPRSIPLPAGMGSELRALVGRGIPKGYTIRRGLRDALRAVGVNSNITPHSLRHTTATRLVKGGVNLMVAGKYLGHSSLKTTQRYVHIEDTDLKDALNRLT